ncbi:MAG TPA: hypothetical protein DDX51_02370 [Clostridiales bacterium]|nr:hypothetical protein [Clostridiales bacterium]
MKQERYHIFFDSPNGLIPGSLDLCKTEAGVSGHIAVLGHGTIISAGYMEGDLRAFDGTIWFREKNVPFHADGLLTDGMLELDITIGSQSFPMTGFPVS